MNRHESFVNYYKLLNDYVILNELLYAQNNEEFYFKFVDIHRQLILDSRNLTDEIFLRKIQMEKTFLLANYAEMIENYFCGCLGNFSTYRAMNKKVASLYNDIAKEIQSAVKSNQIDIHKLIDCINEIEECIPVFVWQPKNK